MNQLCAYTVTLPKHDDLKILVEDFNRFFLEKPAVIRSNIVQSLPGHIGGPQGLLTKCSRECPAYAVNQVIEAEEHRSKLRRNGHST